MTLIDKIRNSKPYKVAVGGLIGTYLLTAANLGNFLQVNRANAQANSDPHQYNLFRVIGTKKSQEIQPIIKSKPKTEEKEITVIERTEEENKTPSESIKPSGIIKDSEYSPQRVVIVDFENKSLLSKDVESLKQGIPNLLANELGDKFEVVDIPAAKAILGNYSLTLDDVIKNPDKLIGKIKGIDGIISGSYIVINNKNISINSKYIDLRKEQEELIKTQSSKGNVDNLLGLVENLASEVNADLGYFSEHKKPVEYESEQKSELQRIEVTKPVEVKVKKEREHFELNFVLQDAKLNFPGDTPSFGWLGSGEYKFGSQILSHEYKFGSQVFSFKYDFFQEEDEKEKRHVSAGFEYEIINQDTKGTHFEEKSEGYIYHPEDHFTCEEYTIRRDDRIINLTGSFIDFVASKYWRNKTDMKSWQTLIGGGIGFGGINAKESSVFKYAEHKDSHFDFYMDDDEFWNKINPTAKSDDFGTGDSFAGIRGQFFVGFGLCLDPFFLDVFFKYATPIQGKWKHLKWNDDNSIGEAEIKVEYGGSLWGGRIGLRF